MRLLLFNLTTDADDSVLGFTTQWINALAAHYEAVDVLTLYAGRLEVAANVCVYSAGKERGFGRLRRILEFYRVLLRLLLSHRYDACFAHMQPTFAVMASPLLWIFRIPITLWYAHKSTPRMLRWAERVVRYIVTPSAGTIGVRSQKVVVTGHGIDTEIFCPSGQPAKPHPFTLVTVGRIAPVKHIDTLIDAAHELQARGETFQLRIVGGHYPHDQAYVDSLYEQVRKHNLESVIIFTGAVKHDETVHEYRSADVMVNLCITGSVDKAPLEAMSCGIPVVTSNQEFRDVLHQWQEQLMAAPDNPRQVADRIAGLMQLSVDERKSLGMDLRQIVIENHSLKRLAFLLVNLMGKQKRG